MAGVYGEEELNSLKDDDGIVLIDAIREYGLSGSLEGVCRRGEKAKAFLELHMEQGTKLETLGKDIGVVKTINSNSWFKVTARGRTDHPSTPHKSRRDAAFSSFRLLAALEDKISREHDGKITVTCGRMAFHPDVLNAIPSRSVFTVDFRSPEQGHIDLMIDFMHSEASRIQQEYDVAFEIEFLKGSPPVDNDPKVIKALQSAVDKLGYSNIQMDSGAGTMPCFLVRYGLRA